MKTEEQINRKRKQIRNKMIKEGYQWSGTVAGIPIDSTPAIEELKRRMSEWMSK